MITENQPVVVLVEDNESDVELTRRAFAQSRIANRLVVARDGEEALRLLLGAGDAKPISPPLVLLDLKLPTVDGIEVLRRLRADPRTRRVPVVVLTSSMEDRDLAACYDNGANSYVRKPVDFEQFAEAVRQLGLYWLILNRTSPVPHE